MANTRMDSVVFEEWLVDWAGNTGEPIVCETLDLAYQYASKNIASGVIWTISKRVCSVTPYATYGLPSSQVPPDKSLGRQGTPVSVTHTRFKLGG